MSPSKTKGVLYLTDNILPEKMWKLCQQTLKEAIGDLELVSSSREPIDFGKNVVTDLPRGYECYFKQILKGLETLTSDLVFIAEHDVLYPKEHFEFTPPYNKIYYDTNWWKVHEDGLAVRWTADQVSGICAPRNVLLKWYSSRVATFDPLNFDRKFEPISGEGSEQWESSVPYIDIRHRHNLTYSKKTLAHFRDKRTAINFEQSTIDRIPRWSLGLNSIY
jgi:hypothetical protein